MQSSKILIQFIMITADSQAPVHFQLLLYTWRYFYHKLNINLIVTLKNSLCF